jgi:hypothetical protein
MKGPGVPCGVFLVGLEKSVHHAGQLAGVDEQHFTRLVSTGDGFIPCFMYRIGVRCGPTFSVKILEELLAIRL